MSTPTRAFVGRLSELDVFDPLGDKVGRVRDVVVTFSASRSRPRVIGLVVEVPGRRRVFVPMTRVTSVEGGQVITTGLVNMRRFEQRPNETLVVAELFEREVQVRVDSGDVVGATVQDIGIEQLGPRGWGVTRAAVRLSASRPGRLGIGRRRGETFVAPIEDVRGIRDASEGQGAARLLETYEDLKPADLAEVIHDLTPQRRAEVAAALADERLADVIEELPEDDQVEILVGLEVSRAADVLEAMEPDDAADLLSELPPERQEELLAKMQPDEAADLRRLLTYDENTAGGLMTTEPVILGPEASIAEALAVVRRQELSTALACTVFVCRPPLETPTGKFLGIVHIQRLLREPPHAAVGGIIDKDVEPLPPTASLGQVTRMLATYDLVGMPVVDEEGHLLGAVTVDDVLDHILPDDWREERHDVVAHTEVTRG
ncbi:magnesium transporter [Phycicoccus sp. HDW14]|uniref:magnesium transporter MgtE N-terminal domain-containing protein n=1 Tax=Phycicoccus sp. HDW14 TaxID=2714941 RepID=UPI00140E71AE|nr:CBS domain-containing protein [Phycicoccus sp. HDW14]QIM20177.1 magnesium transporter [Phycicoccus sp. HDW14]